MVRHLRRDLCDVFSGACAEVRRRESESIVCPCIIRIEVNGHFLFPLAALAEVYAVHTNKPVGAGDYLHHQGQQGAPGLHDQLRGAVPDAVRDAGCTVHGANCASLPGLLGSLHQLHRHPDLGKALHPCTSWSTMLPQPKMAIMAHRYELGPLCRGPEQWILLGECLWAPVTCKDQDVGSRTLG